MQIKILDQVHLSGVRATTLAAGEIVEVSRDLGAELMKKHPDKFEVVGDLDGGDRASGDHVAAAADVAEQPAAKAEDPPQNKAEARPANKAATPPRKTKHKR